jgi:hypothetical protein
MPKNQHIRFVSKINLRNMAALQTSRHLSYGNNEEKKSKLRHTQVSLSSIRGLENVPSIESPEFRG